MKPEEFNKHLKEMQGLSVDTLTNKAQEYATDGDRLHNFKVAAGVQGITPVQALGGMMAKHTVSVYDMIGTGKTYPIALWEEKIKDSINYLFLLWALIQEEKEAYNDQGNKITGTIPTLSTNDLQVAVDNENSSMLVSAERGFSPFLDKSIALETKAVTPSATSQMIQATSPTVPLGTVVISGDASLTSANIKDGVDIFGVQGTYAKDDKN